MAKVGWQQTLKTFTSKKFLFLFLLGISSGLPLALTGGTLQAWMTDLKVDLKTIGLFASMGLPYTLKFLWAPLMDRYSIPFLGRWMDRRRSWTLFCQVGLVSSLLFLSSTNALEQAPLVVLLCLIISFFSASQDIVLDAYRREILSDEELGLGSGVFVNGYLIAFRWISGAGAILISTFLAWSVVFQIMAVLMGILAVVTFLAPSPLRLAEAPKSLKESVVGPLKEFFSNPSALTILAFIILYKLGDNLAGSMTIPFILKNGYTKLEYVAISKGVGFVGILIGSLLGGFIVLRLKIHRSLWLMGFLQAVSTFGFALLAGHDKNLMALSAVMFFENLTAGMGTSAFTAFMASVTNVKFTATQYALLSSLMGVPRVIFASRTGVIAEQMGWFGFFNFCTLIAIPGMFLILFLEKPPTSGWKKWLHHFLIAITIAAGIYATIASVIDLLGLK